MVLPSNSSPIIHPDNNASKFKIDWETPILLDGKWEMALYEISFFYPPSTYLSNTEVEYVVKKPQTYAVWFDLDNDKELVVNWPDEEDDEILITLENGHLTFVSTRDEFKLIFEDKNFIPRAGFDHDNPISTNKKLTGRYKFSPPTYTRVSCVIYYKEILDSTYKTVFDSDVSFSSVEHLSEYMLEKFTPLVFKSISLLNGIFKFSVKPTILKIVFSDLLMEVLGLSKRIYSNSGYSDWSIESTLQAKLQRSNKNMYIYTNIIEPILLGDQKAPLLKSVWLEDKFDSNEVVFLTMKQPMYCSISSTRINNIEFNIRDDSGRFINFAKDTVTSLTVHLRHVR